MISVIIPVLNEQRAMLLRAVDSIRTAFPEPGEVEIVIVDDGSDVPVEPIDGCVLVRHGTNRGIAAAMNTGLDASTGDYVAHLSATDVRFPSRRDQLAVMKANGWDACFARCVDERTGKVRPLNPHWKAMLFSDGQFQWSTTIVKRWVHEQVRVDESLRYAEDWDWMMRVELACGWHLFDEVVGTATEWDGGWSDVEVHPARAELRRKHRKVVVKRAFQFSRQRKVAA